MADTRVGTPSGTWRVHDRRYGAGDGRAVVGVHGVGVSGRYLVPTARALAPDHEVHLPDLPGSGRSSREGPPPDPVSLADTLAAWMGAAGLAGTLLANSVGCQVAVECAIRHPDRVRALVLVGPTVDPAARSWPRQVARWLANAPREDPRLGLILLRDYLDAGVVRPVRTFRAALAHRVEERLPAVTVPTLVVRGERDPIVPQPWAEQAARLVPDARLAVVRGAAHTVNFTHPEQLAGLVRDLEAEL